MKKIGKIWYTDKQYIELLEEENKRLNSINKIHIDRIQELMRRLEKRTNRINKAIEYCILNQEFTPRLTDVEDILKGEENESN